jgi:hypothetical protein
MRRTPRLRFLYDDSVDRGFRVDAALRDLHEEERDDETGGDAGGESGADAGGR